MEGNSGVAFDENNRSSSRKRRRGSDAETDDAADLMNLKITPSTSFWFGDGNVILQIERTQFCVHRGCLTRHSRVFEDMFDIPQPEDKISVGCPVIHLMDAVEDWERLLGALYDFTGILSLRSQKMPAAFIVSLLRLSKKYEFQAFWIDALNRLQYDYPTTLNNWELFLAKRDSYPYQRIYYDESTTKIDIVNIALETGIQTILPTLYYDILSEDILAIVFEGKKVVNGERISKLSPEAVQHLLCGHQNLLQAAKEHCFGWLTRDSAPMTPKCQTTQACFNVLSKQLRKIWRPAVLDYFGLDNWSHIQQTLAKGLCANCRGTIKKEYQQGREKIWASLPEYFLLPVWDELKDWEF